MPCILHFESPKAQPPELLDKTERLINVAPSLKVELPLPSCSPESSKASSAASQPSQVKIEPAHINDESTAAWQMLTSKKQKYMCKQFKDIIVAQNLLKAHFPQLNGLRSILLQNNSSGLLAVDEVKNKLQIVHCKAGHHWIVAITVKCTNNQALTVLLIPYTVPWMNRQR